MLHKTIIIIMCVALVISYAACKKESISLKEAISGSESITKKANAADALQFAQKRTKGEGAKGLLENAISGSPEELAFAVGANFAEIDVYYLLIADPKSDVFLDNALLFFYNLFQKQTLYNGDREDYNATAEKLRAVYKQQVTLQAVKEAIEPFLNNISAAIVKKYGKDASFNMGLGYHTLITAFYAPIPQSTLNKDQLLAVYTQMKTYLESKGKSSGKSYAASNEILKEVKGQITNKVVVGTNADIILNNYMN